MEIQIAILKCELCKKSTWELVRSQRQEDRAPIVPRQMHLGNPCNCEILSCWENANAAAITVSQVSEVRNSPMFESRVSIEMVFAWRRPALVTAWFCIRTRRRLERVSRNELLGLLCVRPIVLVFNEDEFLVELALILDQRKAGLLVDDDWSEEAHEFVN